MDYRKSETGFTIRLDRGEELVETLTAFLAERGVGRATLTAIGAVDDPELGLFTMKTREYLRRRFEGEYELASLTGNVTLVDGKPFAHMHALLSDEDCRVIGGHLFSARVSVTCEIDLRVYKGELRRSRDDETTLNLIDFDA